MIADMLEGQRSVAINEDHAEGVSNPPPGRLSLSLDEVCGLTGFGMTSVRQAIDADLLPAHRLGKRVIVKRADVDEFLKKLPRGFAKKIGG
jgi:excisionase family DNA binding protein